MKKFSRSFQIFLDLPQIFLVREYYFSTNEKVFSIVKNISGSSKIYLERQIISRPTKFFSTTFVQYGFPYNWQILLHITWFFKQKLTPPQYQHYPNSFLIKERRKSENLAKIVFFDVGTTVHHTFPSSELQCLPRGDPKNLCVNTRIRLLVTHSLLVLLEKFIYLLELMRMKMSKILLFIM